MRPLIKWPGGKSGEIKKIERIIPEFKRYIEPFFGGGALFFHLKPENAVINDISKDLIEYYRLIKKQDKELRSLLLCYDTGFANIISVCDRHYGDLLSIYALSAQNGQKAAGAVSELTSNLKCEITRGVSEILLSDDREFISHINKTAADKIRRTVKNDLKQPFCDEDLKNNLITGFTSGFYMYFRKVFNDMNLGRIASPSVQYKAANFYFIREYCYGSMFRYNKNGEFNIPYGGMSYNKKNFSEKIENMFCKDAESIFKNTEILCSDFEDFFDLCEIKSDDFMFLDPPYDTDFSDYEGSDFTKSDQDRLARRLKKTPAQFILVIKNTDFIHSLYKDDFNILSFDNRYTYNVRSRNDRSAEHLIITNLPV
ncbi:MAG: DNA adenine methylase [Oscillospiraceae bacterium]|nr:DNA adenine methylase [Oscillospiraceae bacterium]